jgi:shikimate kinase
MTADRMSQSIILIGPPGAGKSTLGTLLAERLGIPRVGMDEVRFGYYREICYDKNLAAELRKTGGFWSMYRYWKNFEVHAVERVLADHQNAVIDFGAGHSVHEEPDDFERVRLALEPFPNVILLLPSPDPVESLSILNDRDPSFESRAPGFTELCLSHHSNRHFAKHIVYSKGKTPEEMRRNLHVAQESGVTMVMDACSKSHPYFAA